LRSILLYHIFPINNWREITETLFQKLPFDRIIVHVSLPDKDQTIRKQIESFFKDYPVNRFIYSPNSGNGEVDALRSFVQTQDLSGFDILTYMHCKGVSKPENKNILDWTKLMRYFLIEKMDSCKKVFKKGYVTFGINKTVPAPNEGFIGSNFFYEGNFVSLNLKKVDLCDAVDKYLENTYYGLEGFWGKLCTFKEGYSLFNSGINHYMMPISEKEYTSSMARFKYNLVRKFYIFRSRIRLKKS
jgi:hypothetical protein